jgi:A/G-specific adenine glycosylase
MLQQTTVTAVVPYFERFLKSFPTLADLANASEAQVFENWSGLGYYSRAKNLRKAAQILNTTSFPTSYKDLLLLPGFGPYTSRAVASMAFSEPVGVVDGNVIRVLSRLFGLQLPWWQSSARQHLQQIADRLVEGHDSGEINQAIMELGASHCRPLTPRCSFCPWNQFCVARATEKPEAYPLKRPRRAREVWVWKIQLNVKKGRAALVKNNYAPFLSGHWIWPGQANKQIHPPKQFQFRHSVTHHDIYIQMNTLRKSSHEKIKWVPLTQLSQVSPTSLMQKTLKYCS